MRQKSTAGRGQTRASAAAPARALSHAPPPLPAAAPELPAPPGVERRPWLSMQVTLSAVAVAGVAATYGLVFAVLQGFPQVLAGSATLLWACGATSLALLGPAFWLLGRVMSGRIERIAAVLDHSEEGGFEKRVDPGPRDDLGILARRVNTLLSVAAAREKRIMQSALYDRLTSLPNRSLLTDRIRHALAQWKRKRAPFAVAVVDLDRFKMINDTLGHAAGDEVLRDVARRLRAAVRDTDTVARLGGDEFVLLLDGGPDVAREVTQRIVDAMKAPLHHLDQLVDIDLSIGVALCPTHGEDELTLLRHADTAMYRAKRRGTGVVFFDGNAGEVRRSYLSMLGEMRAALEGGQFVLEYQPKLDLHSGLIVGLEGLVRWNHPTRGRVPPGEFIKFAEQTGFMREITRWVVAEGARFAGELSAKRLDLRVAVNVSAHDIENPDFSGLIAETLRVQRIEPRRLCLEITESGVVSETRNALNNLREIAEQGVRLSVDDFGTGYATLTQLQQLPVNELKIDRSFVSGMNQNRGGHTIVRSTIDLGKQLGLTVVAEGVETVEELRALAAMGCDEVQGYYLAKPMPASEVTAWVEMRHALYASSREDYFRMMVKK